MKDYAPHRRLSLGTPWSASMLGKLHEIIFLFRIHRSWNVTEMDKPDTFFFLYTKLAVTARGWAQATLSASRIQPQRPTAATSTLLPPSLPLGLASSMPLRHLFKYYHEGRPQHTPAAATLMELHCLGCRPARPWAASSPHVNSAAYVPPLTLNTTPLVSFSRFTCNTLPSACRYPPPIHIH